MSYLDEVCAEVIDGLEAIGVELFLNMADSFGTPVIAHLENSPTARALST